MPSGFRKRSFVVSLGFMVGLLAGAAQADNRPPGYVTLCTSHDASCTLQHTSNVAFGRDNRFAYKVLSGTFVCNNATFGSDAPAEGECSIPGRLSRPAPRPLPSVSNYGDPGTPRSAAPST